MTAWEVRKKEKAFCRKNGLRNIDYSSLSAAVEKLGFTVIEFNHILNSTEVQSLIDSLKLSDAVLRTRGFSYADSKFRLVFVHEDLTDEEKTIVLAHEAGHIVLGHLSSASIIGRDVREEFEANEFAHFLLNRTVFDVMDSFVARHKKAFCLAAIVLLFAGALTVGILHINRQAQYYGEYYITDTGNRYHEKECIFIKDKSNVQRLTKEQFESGEYERCHTCLPADKTE